MKISGIAGLYNHIQYLFKFRFDTCNKATVEVFVGLGLETKHANELKKSKIKIVNFPTATSTSNSNI